MCLAAEIGRVLVILSLPLWKLSPCWGLSGWRGTGAMTKPNLFSRKEKNMKTLQKIGGFAALIGAATNLFALVTLITLLAPTGYGSDDPGQVLAFLADNQAFMRVWYVIIYLVFGVSLIFLSLALYERLKD